MKRNLFITTILFVAITGTYLLVNNNYKVPNVEESEVLDEVTQTPSEILTPTDAQPMAAEVPKSSSASPIQSLTPTAKPLSPKSPTLTSSQAGEITTLKFGDLQKDTLYKVDLASYGADTLVVSWPRGSALYWSNTAVQTVEDLAKLPIDEDEKEANLYSGLLDIPSDKILYLYPKATLPEVVVSLLLPSTDTQSFSAQATTGIYNANAGASYTSLPMTTRDEWGANPSSWDSTSSANIDDESRLVWLPIYFKAARIVVHHTATSPNNSNPASAVRSVYLYHTYIRDWGDIGYNFVIDQNGTIYQGKLGGDETQGYHAFGAANRISIGISLIGDFTSTTPTSKARSSLIKLMAEKAAFYGFSLKYSDGGNAKWKDPSYTVFGHRTSYSWDYDLNRWDVNQTACPGNSFAPQLPALVSEAEKYRQNNYTQIKQLVTDVEKSFSMPHDEGKLIVQYNVPNDTDEAVIESYLPEYSGITDYVIDGNTVTITVSSIIITHPTTETEYLLPPMGWTGYDNEYQTFTGTRPFVLNGPEDRAKTLLKIFRMDSRVKAADLLHHLETQ